MTTIFTVYVDDNYHYQDQEYRRKRGEFASWDEAVAVCKSIVDSSLAEHMEPGMKADALYAAYTRFGEDPFIVPAGDERFSAWNYARDRSKEICGAP